MLTPQFPKSIRLTIAFVLFLMSLQSVAQNTVVSKADSLTRLIENAPDDTLKAHRMYLLSMQYDYFNSTERVTWMVSAFNLSRTIDYANGMNTISPRLVNLLFHRNMNDLALRYCYEYMGWLTDKNDSIGLQKNYNLYANLLGSMDKHQEAFEFYNKALDYNTRAGNKKQCAYILSNLSILMKKMGKPDSALYYSDRSIELLRQEQDVSALANVILGKAEILLLMGDTASALPLAREALSMYTEINIVLGIVNSESVLGDIALKKNHTQEALLHYMNALQLLDSLQLYDQKTGLCLLISECLGTLGRYNEAYEYQLLYKQYNDSSAAATRKNKMTEIEVKYEITRKDNELQEKNAALEQSRNQRNILLGGVISVAILLMVALWAIRSKKKSNTLLAEQKKLVEEKQQDILDSIHYAHRIQNALLSYDELIRENLPTHFILHKPKDIVSGDFYIAWKNKFGFYIAVCDSTGHGVPGAFMSLLNSTFLNEALREKQLEHPDEIFNYVRGRLIESISKEEHKDGFDGILFRITPDNIEYAAAGNAPVVVRKGKFSKLDYDRMPVGKSDKQIPFTRYSVSYETGDAFYLFTDGYADQFGGAHTNGKKFKLKNLCETLQTIHTLQASEQREQLNTVFENWKGANEQVDDVLVVGFVM
jgi:serine phosphatase RsbU (regulator of sigma subunit)